MAEKFLNFRMVGRSPPFFEIHRWTFFSNHLPSLLSKIQPSCKIQTYPQCCQLSYELILKINSCGHISDFFFQFSFLVAYTVKTLLTFQVRSHEAIVIKYVFHCTTKLLLFNFSFKNPPLNVPR